MLTETDVTGASAFRRLFTEQAAALEVPLPDLDEPASLEEAPQPPPGPRPRAACRGRPGRDRGAAPGAPHARVHVFNTLLADKATKDRLRNYPHWLASRNLANEASDESVEALIAAVAGRYDLARRWYTLKARLLGLDRLAYYDRMAPVSRLGRAHPLRRGAAHRARLLRGLLLRAGRAPRRPSSRTATSTARPGPASAAALSAPTRCRRRTPTCCSTTPPVRTTC